MSVFDSSCCSYFSGKVLSAEYCGCASVEIGVTAMYSVRGSVPSLFEGILDGDVAWHRSYHVEGLVTLLSATWSASL